MLYTPSSLLLIELTTPEFPCLIVQNVLLLRSAVITHQSPRLHFDYIIASFVVISCHFIAVAALASTAGMYHSANLVLLLYPSLKAANKSS